MLNAKQIEKMRQNLQEIADYCRAKYIPLLQPTEELSVEFGKWKHYRNSIEAKREHGFGFSHSGKIWYSSGGLVQSFDTEDPYDWTVYSIPSYAKDLILEWANVKHLIEEELKRREEERRQIKSFQVEEKSNIECNKVQHMLELTFRLNGDHVEVDVYEPESGDCMHFSAGQNKGFGDQLLDEINSWLPIWAEEDKSV